MKKARCYFDGSRVDTMGFKLAEGKGLREEWHSKELWKSVERLESAPFGRRKKMASRNFRRGLVLTSLILDSGICQ
jgi:hypothetical protein